MRIISGKYRGRVIRAPKTLPVRPTTDYAKESLFNILNNHYYFDEIDVLDLFAGTGNIAYEFVSRGSEKVIAVDADRGCVGFINKMIVDLKMEAELEVHKADAIQFLGRTYDTFDIVFADPPYDFENYDALISGVFDNKLLKDEDARFILEHSEFIDFEDHALFYESRKYGSVNYTFFKPL